MGPLPAARLCRRLGLVAFVAEQLQVAVVVAAALLERSAVVDLIATGQPHMAAGLTGEPLSQRNAPPGLDP